MQCNVTCDVEGVGHAGHPNTMHGVEDGAGVGGVAVGEHKAPSTWRYSWHFEIQIPIEVLHILHSTHLHLLKRFVRKCPNCQLLIYK